MSLYQKHIAKILGELKSDADPRHVEAWMRVEHSTLDALSPARFKQEVEWALYCIIETPIEESEELALSYGLRKEEK